ncbi:MAG: T9SS type A sorting domain-containing protein [Lewinellaceae bacterium]|nr:T9SS type A sorting domain-containing protein [Saprospiraceae bacterium]MCB9333621.1 T9SS type A sorting domain-containing protein [Lewinellaceae bacterium]
MRQVYLLLCLTGFLTGLSAQNSTPFWEPVSVAQIALPEGATPSFNPVKFQAYDLRYDALAQRLAQAPMEFTEAADRTPLRVELPSADGTIREFKVWESPIMAPELAARYPGIRNFAGIATDGSGATVRMGTTYQGFHAFQFEKDGSVQSIRPYAMGQTRYYLAYKLSDLPKESNQVGGILCGVEADDQHAIPLEQQLKPGKVTDRGSALVTLKTYTIAISARGEYSQFFGGTKPLVLSAINTALNYIVAIQERDFSLRLILHPMNDQIIFLDPNTDPFSGNTVGEWMSQNPAAIDSILPNSSYDVGHVFSRYIVGDQVGVVSGRACNSGNKARGASSAQNPQTEYFYLVAAHEFGHQLDASHTWANCPNVDMQIAPATAFEPGSGSTIMSYAGSCIDNNVQNDNDTYYHIGSIIQAQTFMWQGSGATCGGSIQTNNNAPEVEIVSPNNVVIPANTPFRLTAAGTDADGDNLNYCWEQYDTDPGKYTLGMPQGNAPAFRSYIFSPSPTRYFPNLADLAANKATTVEVLPTYNRNLKFRVTVRDRTTGAGGQAWKEISIAPRVTAGPFRVTYPNNAGVSWWPGEYQTVTWDVANTNISPVNSQRVNIKLSINGGQSFPITLASNVLNQGRYCVKVPNNPTTMGRIMVEAADNVFFDISNNNISIQSAAQPDISFCASSVYDTICLPLQYSTVISTASTAGFSDPITLAVEGLPNGVTASLNPNPVVPGNDVVLTLDIPANQPELILNYKVKGTAGALTDSTTNTLWIIQNDFSPLTALKPADGAGGQVRLPTLQWTTVGAATYQVELASSPSFAAPTIVASASNIAVDSFAVTTQLNEGAIYYWRFRPTNACGVGDWVGPFAFATGLNVCATYVSTDVPKPITPNAVTTVESKINLPAGGVVSGVKITRIQGNHAFFRDLEMRLISPAGTDVLLFTTKCGGVSANFNFGFDDASPTAFACPPNNTGVLFKPENSLGAMNGQNTGGDWILRVKDNAISSGGNLSGFDFEVCSSTSLNPPFLVNNNPLQVPPGGNAPVSNNLLKTDDANNGPDELVYTLLTIPAFGELHLNASGVAMQPGDQFTQTNLDNNALRFFDYGNNVGTDAFCFVVTDGEGGLVKDCFTIQPFPVSTSESLRALNFLLAPNPATETVRLTFGEALRSDTRIRLFDAAGRLVRTERVASGQQAAILQLNKLPEGLYTVSVDNAEGSGVRKLVVR